MLPQINRRDILLGAGSLPFLSLAVWGRAPKSESDLLTTHALSLLGDVKYPPDFSHFDGLDPTAPKGGTIRLPVIGGFNSLNPFIVQGSPARGILTLYDTLLKSSFDEPATQYPLVAKQIRYPRDFSYAIFDLDPRARFHDGEPMTADDVVFSFNLLKARGQPHYRQYYRNVVEAEALDAHTVRFAFDQIGNRELPSILGQMVYILPRHIWQGREQAFEKSSLEPPVGSGPYRVLRVEPGRFIEYERVRDYWARDLPVNAGQHNFDRVRYDFYLDPQAALTAFLAGASDVRVDMSPKSWATRYDVPQVTSGRIKRMVIPDRLPNGMLGLFFNLRRPKFQDRRVREALMCAFDFEWVNGHLLYGARKRLNSYFANSDLAAQGVPEGDELALLAPYRRQLPPELFEQPFRCPVTSGDGHNRANLRRAMDLFFSAGYELRDGQMVYGATGAPFALEFLADEPDLQRHVNAYIGDLEKIGIRGTVRVVDPSQYRNRVGRFDFDIISDWQRQSLSPGNELRDMFGSAAADRPGSMNVAGVRHPVIDALIEAIVFAQDRTALETGVRALDRVLLWEHLCIPLWYLGGFPCAYWDRFGMPSAHLTLSGLPSTWWPASAPNAQRGA